MVLRCTRTGNNDLCQRCYNQRSHKKIYILHIFQPISYNTVDIQVIKKYQYRFVLFANNTVCVCVRVCIVLCACT
jgi:hypothetical protein